MTETPGSGNSADALRAIRDERITHAMAVSDLMDQTRTMVLAMQKDGATITDLAVWAGVSRPTIYSWLEGKSYIPPVA